MVLYFQAGKNKRIAIDTINKKYILDCSYLGGLRSYIKTDVKGYRELIEECKKNGYQTCLEIYGGVK